MVFALAYLLLRLSDPSGWRLVPRVRRCGRTGGSSPPAGGPRTAGGKASSSPPRATVHGCHEQDLAKGPVVIVSRQPANAASLAPGALRRKWTFRRTRVGGRPPISAELRGLILQMGRENPRWGCLRIKGELAKLGVRISATAIRTLLRSTASGRRLAGRVPAGASSCAPRRRASSPSTSSPWRQPSCARSTCSSPSSLARGGWRSSTLRGSRTLRGSLS